MEPCVFVDAKGREWTVRFTGSVILRYEQAMGGDLSLLVGAGRVRFADAAMLLWYGTGAREKTSLDEFADAVFPPTVWERAKAALRAGLDNAFHAEEGKPDPPSAGST
jgi:hypothetical protein